MITSKPPAGWRPGAKSEWGAIPDAARDEIHRREKDIAMAIQAMSRYRSEAQAAIAKGVRLLGELQDDGVDLDADELAIKNTLAAFVPSLKKTR